MTMIKQTAAKDNLGEQNQHPHLEPAEANAEPTLHILSWALEITSSCHEPTGARTTPQMFHLLGDLVHRPFELWNQADFQTAVNVYAGGSILNDVYDGTPQSNLHNSAVGVFHLHLRCVCLVETCPPLKVALSSFITSEAHKAIQNRKAQLYRMESKTGIALPSSDLEMT